MKRSMIWQMLSLAFPMAFLRLSVGEEGGGGGGGESSNKTFTLEYVQELREENKRWRLKASEAEKKVETAEAAVKTAQEKATADIAAATAKHGDELKAANQAASDRILQSELRASAVKAGMVDLDGLKLAELSKVKLKDDGTVDGADALFEEMKKAKPYLFGKTGNSSSTNPPPGSNPPGAKKATEMTDAEYAAARTAIRNGQLPT